MGYFLETLVKLIPFLRVTIYIAVWAMILGLIFGTLLAAMKLSGSRFLKKIAELFTTLIRCTPVIVLLFLSYYGLPLLFGIVGLDISNGSKTAFSIAALTVYSSATLSEIIRPAYLSINKGQMEAALTVGLTTLQAMVTVILPQVVFVALPNMGNMLIALFQESALAYLIGVIDVMGQAKVINSMNYGAHIIEVYFAVSLLYWMLSLLTGKFVDMLTYRFSKIMK
ncbi:amino acid ABC transporter permease [Anaerotignum sp.]|nr:amino acid ABC transporter permease [Anaerotignum sp.]MBQ7759364.1 amino acid ABC transporter permease [Anaerotignum sp.]